MSITRLQGHGKDAFAVRASLACFDKDAFASTRDCLEMILDRLPAGAVVGLGELNVSVFGDETAALLELLGGRRPKLQCIPNLPGPSFVVIE